MNSIKSLLYSDKIYTTSTPLNTRAPIHLDYNQNPHSMSLQRSNYVCIEDDICRANIYEGTLSNKFKAKSDDPTSNHIDPYTGKEIPKLIKLDLRV